MRAVVHHPWGGAELPKLESGSSPDSDGQEPVVKFDSARAKFPSTVIIRNAYREKGQFRLIPGNKIGGDVTAAEAPTHLGARKVTASIVTMS